MSKLQITLTDDTKTFVEDEAAQARCTPDEFVQCVLEDLERSKQRRKLNAMLLVGYEQLRQGLGRVMNDADWKRLERRVEKKLARSKK
jgi:hypothetical protein